MLDWITRSLLGPTHQKITRAEQNPRAHIEQQHTRMRQLWMQSNIDPTILGQSRDELRYQPPQIIPSPNPRFATTTTGKKIPWTPAHRQLFQEFQKDIAATLLLDHHHTHLITHPALIAQANWETTPEGGYSAALAMEDASWVLKSRLQPPLAILTAPSIAARIQGTQTALQKNPRALSGIPSYAAAILYLLAQNPENTAALQHIQTYTWSGMALGPAHHILKPLLSPSLSCIDIASGTEGPLGLPTQPGTYRLARQAIHLFERQGNQYFADELEPHQTYRVLITSGAGLCNYPTGDKIIVTQTNPLRFQYAPQDQDPTALCERLGTPWFRYFDSENPELLTEGEPHAPSLPPHTRIQRLKPGTLATATLRMGLKGYPKLPWIYQSPELHKALLSCL